ncbi:methyl-CpG-binding protein [Sansalvadorimonas verongulae]|nr:methyl-CpG-binding protein [Sansalvadorimonas verongulae]
MSRVNQYNDRNRGRGRGRNRGRGRFAQAARSRRTYRWRFPASGNRSSKSIYGGSGRGNGKHTQ